MHRHFFANAYTRTKVRQFFDLAKKYVQNYLQQKQHLIIVMSEKCRTFAAGAQIIPWCCRNDGDGLWKNNDGK